MAVKDMVENGSPASVAMINAGYSPATAEVPGKLTKSKSFIELMEKYLPENHLLKKHRDFLNTPRRIRSYKKGDLVEETEETDPSAVKALDMAYKLKGKYVATTNNNVLVVNISGHTAERYGKVDSVPEVIPSISPNDENTA
jgi:hypothetical protein